MNRKNLKLKYYMRGLGIGIILTTVIISIAVNSNEKGKMTDQKIMEEAKKLGMIMPTDKEQQMSKLEEDIIGISKEDMMAEKNHEQTMEQSEVNVENGQIFSSEQSGEEQSSKEQLSEETSAQEEPPSEEQPSEEPPSEEQPSNEQSSEERNEEEGITFQITRGMNSGSTSRLLEEIGVIEKAQEFDRYLIQNGYSSNIMIGEYEVKKGAGFEEIAKLITK